MLNVSTPRSVLMVDHEFGLAETVREMLCESGYEVALALNGRLALDIVREGGVDVVITALMMPVMDGLELTTTLRANAAYCAIPVIMMTSLPTAVAANPALFDVVLRKPFTPEALLGAMKACFEARTAPGAGGTA